MPAIQMPVARRGEPSVDEKRPAQQLAHQRARRTRASERNERALIAIREERHGAIVEAPRERIGEIDGLLLGGLRARRHERVALRCGARGAVAHRVDARAGSTCSVPSTITCPSRFNGRSLERAQNRRPFHAGGPDRDVARERFAIDDRYRVRVDRPARGSRAAPRRRVRRARPERASRCARAARAARAARLRADECGCRWPDRARRGDSRAAFRPSRAAQRPVRRRSRRRRSPSPTPACLTAPRRRLPCMARTQQARQQTPPERLRLLHRLQCQRVLLSARNREEVRDAAEREHERIEGERSLGRSARPSTSVVSSMTISRRPRSMLASAPCSKRK